MNKILIIIAVFSTIALNGCFLAGLGIGAVGGGAAVHMYDTKPNHK